MFLAPYEVLCPQEYSDNINASLISIPVNGMHISASYTVENLGLNYSCPFNLHEQAQGQAAVAKRIAAMIPGAFCTQDCRTLTFRSHARPHIEYCPVIFTHMRKVQREFTRNLPGPSSNLNHRARCELLGLQPLWLRRVLLNLAFLFTPCRNNVLSATDVTRGAESFPFPISSINY